MPPTPGNFIWYELMTTDAAGAGRFYEAVIGWKVAGRAEPLPGGQDYRNIGRSDGGNAGGILQLSPGMVAGGARPAWVGYLPVADVDAAVRRIQADGGGALMPKMTLPVGDIAMVTDPAGTPFYVMRPVPPPGQPDAVSDVFDPAATERVRWNELASPDLAGAKAFYARHFGFEFRETMDLGPLGDYCFFDVGGVRAGAIMRQPERGVPAQWLFYFGVESATAACRAIRDGGGRVTQEPHQAPGGDWLARAVDPQGASFGIVGGR